MKSSDGGKTWTRVPRRARRRRLSEPVDQPDRSEDPPARQRSGRGRHASTAAQTWTPGTTSRPRSSITSPSRRTSRIACVAVSRRAGRCASRAAASTARSRARLAPAAIIEYGYAAPDPRDPDIVYGAGRTAVTRYRWSHGTRSQNITPIVLRGAARAEAHAADRLLAGRPDILYYAANTVFSTTDGGQSWQTISPDLRAPDPGMPPTSGRSREGHAAQAPRRRVLARTFVQDHAHALGRHRRRQALGHARRRRALERHHAAGRHAVEQGHAARCVAVRRHDGVRVRQPAAPR